MLAGNREDILSVGLENGKSVDEFANFPWLTNITYFIVVAPSFFIFSNNSLYINYSINIDENNHMSTITKWALHLSQFYFIHYKQ